MRVFVGFAVAVAVFATLASSADAATKKKQQPAIMRTASGTIIQPTRTIIHNPNGTTTVITVPRRSYLDIGTEVSPGDTTYMDYMLPPGGDPGHANWFFGPDLTGSGGYPLPGAFSLPGFNPNTPF